MAEITIEEGQIKNVHTSGSVFYLQYFALRTHFNSSNQIIPGGEVDGGELFKEVTCSKTGTTVDYPAHTIDSTTDAVPDPLNTLYTVILVDQYRNPVLTILAGFPVPATPTGTSLKNLAENSASTLVSLQQRDTIVTLMERYLANIDTALYATTSRQGKGVLSYAAKVVGSPIFVGDNDPRLAVRVTEFDSISDAITAVTAIAAGGAYGIISIAERDEETSDDITIPENVLLEFKNGRQIVGDGATIEFEGIGLVDPLSLISCFSGFSPGDITFTGEQYPSNLSINLFDTGDDSLSARVRLADAALDGKPARMIAYPSTGYGASVMDSTATITTGHTLFFKAGDYDNTIATWGLSAPNNTPPFLMESWTCLDGEPGAVLYESNVSLNTYIAAAAMMAVSGADGTCEGICIKNLRFQGNASQIHNGSASTIILGNCKWGLVTNCVFDDLHAYTIVVGGYGSSGNYAEGCVVSYNTFIKIGTQVVSSINSKSTTVAFNKFYQKHANGAASYTVIDFEPNAATDYIEDARIFGNELYCDNTTAKNFVDADVNTSTETFHIPDHDFVTGQLVALTNSGGAIPVMATVQGSYYIIRIDDDNLRLATTLANARAGTAAGVSTAAGGGTHTISVANVVSAAITVQATVSPGVKRASVCDNIVIGAHFDFDNTSNGNLSVGIQCIGIESLDAINNVVNGAYGGGVFATNCRNVNFGDNRLRQIGNVGIAMASVAEGDVYANRLRTSYTPVSQVTTIAEVETSQMATASGSTLTRTTSIDGTDRIRFYRHWRGLYVTFNATDYLISAVNTIAQTLTTSVSVGTVAAHTFVSGDTNAGTNSFHKVAHGFQTGALVFLEKTSGLSGLTSATEHYVIRTDADNYKLAPTKALADAGTPEAIGSTGAGTITPMLLTKFSSTAYVDNTAPGGITLDANGSSWKDKGSVTIDFASVSANTIATQTFTLQGARTGDSLHLNPSAALTAGLLISHYWVSASNTVSIVLNNTTGSPINEASATWTFELKR